jgi:site-specific DNA-methyltransferase (adenine-specific)
MMDRFDLHLGDCRTILAAMGDATVDSIVTDPPYELGFMGKGWDNTGIAADPAMWTECLRVLKPGGHLLAFSGSRTYHRMACAIEDAGFELRDQIMWIYGSGFPKSKNLGGEWQGWGTALKPAHEPICVARKPLVGTVAANVFEHGTGALNIDACRVPSEPMPRNSGAGGLPRRHAGELRGPGVVTQPHELGRWPANVIHDGSAEVLAAFPDAPGQIADASRDAGARKTQNAYGAMRRGRAEEPSADSENEGAVGFKMKPGMRRIDAGSAARFFYCAKSSPTDRNEGCDALPDREGGMNSNTSGQHITRRDGWLPKAVKNNHPTVKPAALMTYLCRLVTPPGGLVLDPFMGSGSTGKACMREGFRFIGIDECPEYVAIARARISHELARVEALAPRQPSLFEVAA